MNEKIDERQASAGQVERPVRPAAVVCDQHVSGGAVVRWAGSGMPCPPETQLYTQAAIDAAVAAERERCAKQCEAVESQAWALWKTTADPIEQGRNIGAQHCADAIRA